MNVRKRGLALLMCICMIFTLLPFSALADATGETGEAKTVSKVEIVDNIANKGRLELKALDADNNELSAAELKAAGYTIAWTKTDSKGINTTVTPERVSGVNYNMAENGAWVNVAYDKGAQAEYTVTVSKDGSAPQPASKKVEWYDALQNPSFEQPNILSEEPSGTWFAGGIVQTAQNNIPHWKTTAADGNIEIGNVTKWATFAYENPNYNPYYPWTWGNKYIHKNERVTQKYYNCDTAVAGDQIAELNCESNGALYQDVLTTPGETMNWNLHHRGRNGTDKMALVIAPLYGPNGASNVTTQDQLTAYINSHKNDTDTGVLVKYLTDGQTWGHKSGKYVIPNGQYLTRFFFVAISTDNGNGSLTEGNLLDNAWFSTEPVPPTADQGTLTITKTIVGLSKEAANTLIAKDGLITYKIGDEAAQNASFTSLTDNEDGSFTATYTINVKVPANSSVPVTVEEDKTKAEVNGYDLTVSNADAVDITDNPTQPVNIGKQEAKGVAFTNTYSKQEGTITINKTVTGLPTDKLPESFKFVINGGNLTDPVTVTATKQDNNTYSAATATLPYGEYTVSEVNADVDGYKLTTTGLGNVSISKEKKNVEVSVENAYSVKTGDLVISKTVTGTDANKDKEFTFIVSLDNENYPTPAGHETTRENPVAMPSNQSDIDFVNSGWIQFTLKDGENFTVKNVPYGTTYTIIESDNDGYNLSATIKTENVQDAVASVADNTTVTGTTTGEPIEVALTNSTIEPAKVELTATKYFDGALAEKGKFTFVLENNLHRELKTVSNGDNGVVDFGTWLLSGEKDFVFYMREVAGDNQYIKYDDTVYKIVITVSKDADGNYIAVQNYSVEVEKDEWLPLDNITFHNFTVGSLVVKKTVSGTASTSKYFDFTVTLMQPRPLRAAADSGEAMQSEVKYGDITFKNGIATIQFKLKDGDVKTINGLPDGIRYTVQELDSNGYTVSAKVADKDVTLTDNTTPVKSIVIGKTTEVVFNNHKSYVYPPNPPIMDEIIVEITGNSDSVVYDGTEHSVKGYTVKISDPRYTEKDFTFTGKAEASGVNAGTYEMGLKAEQFKNTNARFTNVKFVIKADGVLTITPKDLTITAGSKTEYGPTPVTCNEWTVSGLAAGDKVESVKITGIQSVPGSSPNVPSDAVIKNAKGADVTKNYAIKYVNGTLTMLEVLNKEDHFNYIIGTPEGLSLPTANVTRAEVATIFFRLMTDDARAKFDSLDNSFSDVAKGKWYNRAISTLAKAGIIKGDPAGTYRPGDPITRAEMAAIIARFGDFKEGGKTFSDISGHWAQKYIELAASNGWINGNPDGTFKPNNKITRAETVAMINRVLNRQTESNDDLLPVSQMTNWSDNMDTAKWYYRDMQEATNNHKAERVGTSMYEKWTEKLPDIDWASYQI